MQQSKISFDKQNASNNNIQTKIHAFSPCNTAHSPNILSNNQTEIVTDAMSFNINIQLSHQYTTPSNVVLNALHKNPTHITNDYGF